MGNLVKEMGKEDFEFLKFRALESLEIAENRMTRFDELKRIY